MWCHPICCDALILARLTPVEDTLSGHKDTSVYGVASNCSIGHDDACAGLTKQVVLCRSGCMLKC